MVSQVLNLSDWLQNLRDCLPSVMPQGNCRNSELDHWTLTTEQTDGFCFYQQEPNFFFRQPVWGIQVFILHSCWHYPLRFNTIIPWSCQLVVNHSHPKIDYDSWTTILWNYCMPLKNTTYSFYIWKLMNWIYKLHYCIICCLMLILTYGIKSTWLKNKFIKQTVCIVSPY